MLPQGGFGQQRPFKVSRSNLSKDGSSSGRCLGLDGGGGVAPLTWPSLRPSRTPTLFCTILLPRKPTRFSSELFPIGGRRWGGCPEHTLTTAPGEEEKTALSCMAPARHDIVSSCLDRRMHEEFLRHTRHISSRQKRLTRVCLGVGTNARAATHAEAARMRVPCEFVRCAMQSNLRSESLRRSRLHASLRAAHILFLCAARGLGVICPSCGLRRRVNFLASTRTRRERGEFTTLHRSRDGNLMRLRCGNLAIDDPSRLPDLQAARQT